jgi:hypothetical protein
MIAWLLLTALALAEVVHDDLPSFARALVREHAAQVSRTEWRAPTDLQRTHRAHGMGLLIAALPACEPADLDRAAAQLTKAGVALHTHRVGAERFVLTEDRDDHGAERAVWRCGPSLPLLLQAPHARYDLLTADLIAFAFVHTTARGAMWSTAHRHDGAHGARKDDVIHPADPTRQPTSPFHTTTLVAAASDPDLRVLQLHGFASDDVPGDLVLASGRTDRPPAQLTAAAIGLPDARLLVHGVHTYVLGATDNALGAVLTTRHTTRFLHAELSRPLRDALLAEPDRLTRLTTHLASLPWTP